MPIGKRGVSMNASVQRCRFLTTGLFASLTLLVTVDMAGCKSSIQKPVAFDPQPPDPVEVARVIENDAKAISDYTPGAAAQNVIQVYIALNSLTDPRAQPLDEQNIERAFVDLRKAIDRCLEDEGKQNLRRLGLFLLARFERELNELVKNTRPLGLTTKKILAGADMEASLEPALKKFVEIGGDFLPLAVNNDLVRDDPSGGIQVVPDTAFFIRLAFKVRWANILPEQLDPVPLMLTDFEREQYDQWVVERSKTAPLARRLQAITNLKARNPSFPDSKAKGIVLFQAGSYDEAAKAFEEALKQNPGDKDVAAYLNLAQRKR